MTRKEHVEWSKKRALELCDKNQPLIALSSVFSDLTKHEETKKHACIELGSMLMIAGHLSTLDDVRNFIEGIQ